MDLTHGAGPLSADAAAATPSRGARLAGIGAQLAVAAGPLAFLMSAGRGRTFFFDEWDWVQHRAEGGLGTLLRPHNGHLMPLPVALYRLQFELVGFTYAWPVRLVTASAHVSPVGDPGSRLPSLPEPARMRGDALLADLELRGTPTPVHAAGCRAVTGETLLDLRPGTAVRIGATGDGVSLAARRFADGFPVTPSLSVAPQGATRVEVLPDGVVRRWQLRVSSPAPFRVCPDA